MDRRGQSPIFHARANVDGLTLDASCVLLCEGILRDIFNQKASTAWHPATVGRVVVSLLLPGSMDAEWLILARTKRHMWPMQMTSQVAALDVPTATFMQRERRRLKVCHIWETVSIRWPLLSDRLFTKHPTGLQWDQLYTIRCSATTTRAT